MKWLWIILALVYLLSPYDIIPGLSALGWIDDIFVLVLLYRYLSRFNRMRDHNRQPRSDRLRQDGPRTQQAQASEKRPQTPYEILDVSPDADREEIKTAYRRLVNQYHPDKVSHLGDEFQQLAEQRFKEIQDAYQRLIR